MTTFKRTDLPTLKYLLAEKPEPITQAGLHPTADQIELYAYHLPNSSLSNLLVCLVSAIHSDFQNNCIGIFHLATTIGNIHIVEHCK